MFNWIRRWFRPQQQEGPIVISTTRFGELTWDREFHWFEVQMEWNGAKIDLSIKADESLDITNQLRVAETLSDSQSEWKRQADDILLKQMLPLKNDDWLGDDEQPIGEDEFLSRIKQTAISISENGGFEFWYDDDSLFGWHSIQLRGTLESGFTDAGL